MTSQAASSDLLRGLTEFGWQAVEENGNHRAVRTDGTVSLEPAGQLELSGAPLATIHETCAEATATWSRSRRSATEAGPGLPRPGLWPDKARRDLPWMPKGRYAIMLELHAAGRRARPRHDASHLHRPGQPRLRRSRHGEEVPGRAGAAAGGHGAVRQLAVHRGQAERLPVYRSTSGPTPTRPHRDAAVRVRGRLRLRALRAIMRSTCRCTSSSATASTSTPPASFRDSCAAGCRNCPGTADAARLVRPPVDRFSRSAAEELPGDARRRRRPWNRICALPAFWVGLLYDDAALDAAWDLVKHSISRVRCSTSPPPGWPAGHGSIRRGTMKAASSTRSTKSSPAARLRPTGCSTAITANGRATSATSTRR
jgi:glutamate--cysteine ligase